MKVMVAPLMAVIVVAGVLGGGLPEGDEAFFVGGDQGRSLGAPACRLHDLRAALLPQRLHQVPLLRLE